MENDIPVKISCITCGPDYVIFFAHKNGFNLYRCDLCKLIFVSPTPDDTSSIYLPDYFSGAENGFGYVNYEEDKKAMREVFLSYLDKIEFITKNRGAILDIGAANGYFLMLAKERGWDVYGVEISDYAASQAKEKGLNVFTGVIKNADFKPESFDVITMWDVIEHLADPIKEISVIASLIKPNGLLVINTPDGDSFFARAIGKRWHQLIPPEHLFYFNPYALELFLSKFGLELLIQDKIGKRFTMQYIFQIAVNWCNFFPLRIIAQFLKNHTRVGNIKVSLNLYDNFFVIFKKNNLSVKNSAHLLLN